jgi:C2 domain
LQTIIQAHSKSREQLLVKLKEQKARERVNAYGLDIDAQLSVRVVEARDLMPMDITGKSDPYVVLRFGNQMLKTKYIH